MSTLGERLREVRRMKNVTQETVADAVNTERPTYANWEIDRTDPDTTTLKRLADYFECSADYLLDREGIYGPPTERWLERFTPETREFITNPDNIGHLEVFCRMARDGMSLEELQQVATLLHTAKKRK